MHINKNNITAVILAGGKGRRLEGQDKGLVIYKNKALIEHVIERIKPQVGSVIINANRNQATYESYGFTVISDDMSDFQGPLAGFAGAMNFVSTQYILTLPCDGPLLPLNLVSKMLSKLNAKADNTNSIIVAHDGERVQSVYALIPVALLSSLQAFLKKDERKVGLWYNEQDVIHADFSDMPEAFFNINKKEQLGEH